MEVFLAPEVADRLYDSASAGFPLPSAWHGLALVSADPRPLGAEGLEGPVFARWLSPFGVDLLFDLPELPEGRHPVDHLPAFGEAVRFLPAPPPDGQAGGTLLDQEVFERWLAVYDLRPGLAPRVHTVLTPFDPRWGAGFLERAAWLHSYEAFATGDGARAQRADALWRIAERVRSLKGCLPPEPLALFEFGGAPLALPLSGGGAVFLGTPGLPALSRLAAYLEGLPVPRELIGWEAAPEGLCLRTGGGEEFLLRGYRVCGE